MDKNFKNIIGYGHIKNELNRIIDILNNKEKYKKLGVNIPKNLLIYGQPGIGKTLFAKSFLNALDRKQYIIRKNKPDGSFVNEINRIITDAIDNQPSVVLLDDLDKFSNNDDDHRNSDEFIAVQSFIDDCKDKDVYFVATANYLRAMPMSLTRTGRFSNKIELNNPTFKDSVLIIKHYLDNKCVDKNVNYEEIARILDGGTCALLEDVINEAGLYAGYNNRELITMNDIIKASLRVIYDAPEGIENRNELQIKYAAYHEAGHVLVSELLEHGSVNLVCVANYFGDKGGITSQTNNENYWYDYNKMEDRIRVLLAGKAAIEVFFNKVDVGCSSDLDRVKRVLDRFYEDYGVSDFKTCYHRNNASPRGIEQKENWISNKMKDYYKETISILFNNKDKLIRIAEELISKEILVSSDIKRILNEKN